MDCCAGDNTSIERDMSESGNEAVKYFDLHIRKDVQAVEDKRESKILFHVPPSFIATFDKIIHSDFPSCYLEITDQEKDGKKLIKIQSKLGRSNTGSLMDVLGMQDQPSYADAMKVIQSRYSIKKNAAGGGDKVVPEQDEEGSQATDV